jgi:hypothetical protein
MAHTCSKHATLDTDTFELTDGHLRGEVRAVCSVCGAELRHEYVLDKTVEDTGEAEYVSC